MRGKGGSCGVSTNEYSCAHHVTWSQNKLWRSTSIFNLWYNLCAWWLCRGCTRSSSSWGGPPRGHAHPGSRVRNPGVRDRLVVDPDPELFALADSGSGIIPDPDRNKMEWQKFSVAQFKMYIWFLSFKICFHLHYNEDYPVTIYINFLGNKNC